MEIAFYCFFGGSAVIAVILGIVISAMEYRDEQFYSSGSKGGPDGQR